MTREQLAEAYPRLAPAIFRRCAALLGRREDALDAAQEIYLLLHRKIGSFRGEADLMTWVYRVATNHCLSELRLSRRRRRALERLDDPDGNPVSEDLAAVLARRQLIERLLARFSRRKVAIVVHRYCHEMKQTEIAELMGISERAVRKALSSFIEHAREQQDAWERVLQEE